MWATDPFPQYLFLNNRKIFKAYYQRETKQGFVEQIWLCYSLKLDVVYCKSCWLL